MSCFLLAFLRFCRAFRGNPVLNKQAADPVNYDTKRCFARVGEATCDATFVRSGHPFRTAISIAVWSENSSENCLGRCFRRNFVANCVRRRFWDDSTTLRACRRLSLSFRAVRKPSLATTVTCFHSCVGKSAYRPGRPIGRLQEPPSRRLFSFRAEGAFRATLGRGASVIKA